MKTLSIELSCGARVETKAKKNGEGFYITVEQHNEMPWFSPDKGIYFDRSYFSGYMAKRYDLAQAFRDIADFIDGGFIVDSVGGSQ